MSDPADPREDEFSAVRKKKLKAAAPMTLAHAYLMANGEKNYLYYQKNIYQWEEGCYTVLSNDGLRADMYSFLADPDIDVEPKQKIVSESIDAFRAITYTRESLQLPCWLSSGESARGYISFKNGLLKVSADDSFELIEHNKDLFITSACDYDYDPDAPPPSLWLKFLKQLWEDDIESIAALQEWFGLMMTLETRLQKMLLLVGPKRGGKSTITRVLRSVVGERNVAGPRLGTLGGRFGMESLIGKSLAIIGDARISRQTDEHSVAECLLSITGEDAINVERKYLGDWTGQLSTRIMLLSNELPRIGDSSGALASRLLVLILKKSFIGQEDRGLTDALINERAAIASWALAGLQRLMTRGDFIQPSSGRDDMDTFSELGSPIAQFIKDECEISPNASVERGILYDAWCQWCQDQGRKYPGDKSTFGRNLRSAAPGIENYAPRVGGRRVRFYNGIGLLPTNSEQVDQVDQPITDPTNRMYKSNNIYKRDQVDPDPPDPPVHSQELLRLVGIACDGLRINIEDFVEQFSDEELLQIDTGIMSPDELRIWAVHFDKKFHDE